MKYRFISAAVIAAWLTLTALGGFSAVYAQDNAAVVVSGDETTVTTTPSGDDTTVINTPANQPTTIEQGDTNTTVVVPYGNWLDAILGNLLAMVASIIAVLFAWASRKLPEVAVNLLRTMQAEQLLTRAAEYGINMTRGAVKGKTLDINVGNHAIATAAQYAVDNGPSWLIAWLGGEQGIREKIIARLPLSEDASQENVG